MITLYLMFQFLNFDEHCYFDMLACCQIPICGLILLRI